MVINIHIDDRLVAAVRRRALVAVALLLAVSALGPDTVRAQAVPNLMAHQGRLLNASSVPVTSTVSVEFAIYGAPSGGSAVWSETKPITPDGLGFYETMLGSTTPLPSILASPAYLQVTVAGEALAPRLQVGSVPFAQHAGDGVPAGFSIVGDTPAAPAGYVLGGSFAVDPWQAKQAMPAAQAGLATAAVSNKIYAIGGVGSAINQEYDPVTNTWATKQAMSSNRYMLAAVAVNNKIYAIGGYSGGPLATVEEYDPATNTWTTKTAMTTARNGHAAVAANNKIYAIGGYNSGSLASVEEYDPMTNMWTTKTAMTTARYGLAAVAANGMIYAIGGFNDSLTFATVEEYDPVNNTWATKLAMPTARRGLAAAAMNNKIYAIGGFGNLSTVEEYDPATNTWATRAAMLTGRYELAAASVNNRLYAIGGSNGGNLSTVEVYDPVGRGYLFTKN